MRKRYRTIPKVPVRQEDAFPVIRCPACGWETWCVSPAAVRRCAMCGREIHERGQEDGKAVSAEMPDLRQRAVV